MVANEEDAKEFACFGDLVRYLRTSYGDRIGQNLPGRPRVTLTALSLIKCLAEHGYPITSGAYSEIESGNTLPRDPVRFWDAICQCLAIDENSTYWWLLRQHYGHDLLERLMGLEEANRLVPLGQHRRHEPRSRQH